MKQVFLGVLLFVFTCLELSAQELTANQVYELLQSYEWRNEDPGRPFSYLFSGTVSQFRIKKTENIVLTHDCDYYLSDTPDTVFVASKMGQMPGSHYIIRRDSKGSRSSWLEIVAISSEHLTLRSSNYVFLELVARPKQEGETSE